MRKQLITPGLLFCLALAGAPSAVHGQAPVYDGRPAAQRMPAPVQQTMPAPVGAGAAQTPLKPTIVAPAAAPNVSVRQLPQMVNAMPASPANPHAVRAAQPMPGTAPQALIPMQAVPSQTSGILPASGQGPQSASPIATSMAPGAGPGMMVAAQAVTATGQPVVVYLPPGSQPHAYHPWPSGEFTYAPGTNVSSEVPDAFWPSPERQPIGGMVERADQAEGGGLFRWPKFARGNSGSAPGNASRPPVRQPGIFNRTEDSLFAAKETPGAKVEETESTGNRKALFGGGRSVPVASNAPAPQLTPPGMVPTVTPGAPQPPTVSESSVTTTPLPTQSPTAAPPGAVTKASTQAAVSVPPVQTPTVTVPVSKPAAMTEVPADTTSDLKWRAKGSPRPVAPAAEPPKPAAAEPVAPVKPEVVEPAKEPAEESPAVDPAEPAPLVQATESANEVSRPAAPPKSVVTARTSAPDTARQKAVLSRDLLTAPGAFVAGLFSPPAPPQAPGQGRALMPGSSSNSKSVEPAPMPQPQPQVAATPQVPGARVAAARSSAAAPVAVGPAPRQERALFKGFALAKSQPSPTAPAVQTQGAMPSDVAPTLAGEAIDAVAEASRPAPALQSELIEAAVPPPVTALVPQKHLVHSGPSRRANPQAPGQHMHAQQIAARRSAEPDHSDAPAMEVAETVRPLPESPAVSSAVEVSLPIAREVETVEAMPTRKVAVTRSPRKPLDRGQLERRSLESRQVTYESSQRGPSLGKLLTTLGATPRQPVELPPAMPVQPELERKPERQPAARTTAKAKPATTAAAPAGAGKKTKRAMDEPGEMAAVVSDEGSAVQAPEPGTTKLRKRNGSTVTVITPGETSDGE